MTEKLTRLCVYCLNRSQTLQFRESSIVLNNFKNQFCFREKILKPSIIFTDRIVFVSFSSSIISRHNLSLFGPYLVRISERREGIFTSTMCLVFSFRDHFQKMKFHSVKCFLHLYFQSSVATCWHTRRPDMSRKQ